MKAELIHELVTPEVISGASPYAIRAHIVDLFNQAQNAEQSAAAWQALAEEYRNALEEIANEPHGCGCFPICQCRTPECRAIELENKKELARGVLDFKNPADALARRDEKIKQLGRSEARRDAADRALNAHTKEALGDDE